MLRRDHNPRHESIAIAYTRASGMCPPSGIGRSIRRHDSAASRAALGVSGYVYQQTTADKVDGRTFGDGNKGQAVAVGSFVRYGPNRNWGAMPKWQYETHVANRAQGNRFMLQFAHAL